MSLRACFFSPWLAGCLVSSLLAPFVGAQAQVSAYQTVAAVPASMAWQQLGQSEKRALSPLESRWSELTETQRSKWRTIARQFDQLSNTEQTAMHARMSEWATLSPSQRNQARLNFNAVQNFPKDEKKSKWDEYQSLSDAQKRELSAGVLSPNKTAAPSAKPGNAERLVQPALRTLPPAAIPMRPPIDKKTLLPLPTASGDSPSKPAPSIDPSIAQEPSLSP